MDVSSIRGPYDWPFSVPPITAECIDEFLDALRRDDPNISAYYDEVDGGSREMANEDDEMTIRAYYLHGGWRGDYDRRSV